MRRCFASAIALCCLALQASPLRADEWPGPKQTQVFSENGERFVRLLPGESVGDTVGFAGAAKGRYAHAELYLRQPDRSYTLVADIELVNPVAPVEALLSNTGALVTFDNWHNAGYGKVVAIYAADGKLLAAKELEALYSTENIEAIPTSVSSRWWRCRPFGWSDPPEQTKVFVHEFRGGYFVFDLTDGSHRYDPGSAPCEDR